jgi:hypothetical protein
MKRKIILVASVSLVLLLGVVAFMMLASGRSDSKVTVSFVNSEIGYSPFPSMVESERLTFAVRNGGSKPAFLDILDIEDAHGIWTRKIHSLGDVEAGKSNHLYLYVPVGSHPRSVRMRVSENASLAYKTRFALRLLIQRAMSRYQGKQVWFEGIKAPVSEFVVKLVKEGQPNGAAVRSLPINSETNRTAPSAGLNR